MYQFLSEITNYMQYIKETDAMIYVYSPFSW